MSGKRGFSLFEVLIAFTIMSMVLVALIPGQARLLGRATEADQRALAFDYALSRALELGVTEPLRIGSEIEQYREWDITLNTMLVERVTQGDIVETHVEIRLRDGRPLAKLRSLGFISDVR
jgi:prepilin-type N-terminal cleavage/methylation domain-containing protein